MSSEEEEEVGYEVEEIIKHRKTASGFSYFLKWKGFPSSENSWVDEEDLDCKELLESYWEKVREEEKKSRKETKETKETNKATKHRRSEPRIQVLGIRKDESGKLFFLVLNKYTKEKNERNFAYVKNHHPNSLIDFFESSLNFNSVINMKMSDIKIEKM